MPPSRESPILHDTICAPAPQTLCFRMTFQAVPSLHGSVLRH